MTSRRDSPIVWSKSSEGTWTYIQKWIEDGKAKYVHKTIDHCIVKYVERTIAEDEKLENDAKWRGDDGKSTNARKTLAQSKVYIAFYYSSLTLDCKINSY